MRTPFITNLGQVYNDPDVVPVAYYTGTVDAETQKQLPSTWRMQKSSSNFGETKQIYDP